MRTFPILQTIRSSRILFHTIVWLALILILLSLSYLGESKSSEAGKPQVSWTMVVIIFCLMIPPVYFHFYLYSTFFSTRRYVLYGVFLIIGLLSYSVFMQFISGKLWGGTASPLSFLPSILLFIGGAMALKLIREDMQHRMKLQELQTKQLQTELHLLKSQINPHFLFNTLNNLFSMARRQHPGTADGIAHLSHLMRYLLYDCSAERVALDKEVLHLQRLVELQKLRFSSDDPIQISFTTEGDLASAMIPPMILIPFVENAFKHGIRINSPSFIDIHVAVLQSQILFTLRNSSHSQEEERINHSGVGLQNVRRQLEILFPGTHELILQSDREAFTVHLTLQHSG